MTFSQRAIQCLCVTMLGIGAVAGDVTIASLSSRDLPIHSSTYTTFEPSAGDLLEGIRIVYPTNGVIDTLPLAFRYQLLTPTLDEFISKYATSKWVCVEIDRVWTNCIDMNLNALEFKEMPAGNHTARVFIADSQMPDTASIRYHQTTEVSFTILSAQDFQTYLNSQWMDKHESSYKDQDLLQWAQKESTSSTFTKTIDANGEIISGRLSNPTFANDDDSNDSPFLIIGIKTSVTTRFSYRQALRETWANKQTLPAGVRVFFLGCQPETDHPKLLQAIALEKRTYGDVLTDELPCQDAPARNVDKVKAFMNFAYTEFRSAKYVMITDDTVYLRIDTFAHELRLLGKVPNVYAGQVSTEYDFLPTTPNRDPTHKQYLPETVYPMDELPPYALGKHYLLSMDCVEFIAENYVELMGLGALDDATIALWMLAIQVHPQHFAQFQNLHNLPCIDNLLSLADLSPMAIRVIHSNLQAQRELCYGFNVNTWRNAETS